MRALAVALLLTSGCTTRDLCAGHDGPCIGVTVTGSAEVDRLRFQVLLNGTFHDAFSSTLQPARSLPVTSALYLDPSLHGDLMLFVDGYDGSIIPIGIGEVPVPNFAGKDHVEVVVPLEPPTDAAVMLPDASPMDLASEDLSDDDLTKVPCPPNANIDCQNFDDVNGLSDFAQTCPTGNNSSIVDDVFSWSLGYIDFRVANAMAPQCYLSKALTPVSTGNVWARFYVRANVTFGTGQAADFFLLGAVGGGGTAGVGIVPGGRTHRGEHLVAHAGRGVDPFSVDVRPQRVALRRAPGRLRQQEADPMDRPRPRPRGHTQYDRSGQLVLHRRQRQRRAFGGLPLRRPRHRGPVAHRVRMRSGAILALLLLGPACSTSDPCAGHDGPCIGVTITGSGTVDSLAYQALVDGTGTFHDASSAKLPHAHSLPVTSALYPAADVKGDITLVVTGYRGSTIAGEGQAVIRGFQGNDHVEVGVQLGALPDLGVPDDASGGGDAGAADFGTPYCPTGPDTLFCYDFDDQIVPGGDSCGAMGTIRFSPAPAKEGSSLMVSRPMTDGASCGFTVPVPSVGASGQLWLRVYVNVDGASGMQSLLLLSFDDTVAVAVGNNSRWDVQTASGIASNVEPPVTPGAWQCIELHFDYSANTVAFLVDGTMAGGITSLTLPPTTVSLGFESATLVNTSTVYFDDLAASTSQIGCPLRSASTRRSRESRYTVDWSNHRSNR